MFGHDNHHANNLPEPNSGLADDNQATAPQVSDDNAADNNGGYIDDISPAVPPASATPTDDTTAPATPAVDDTTTSTAAAAAPAVAAPAAPASGTPDTDALLDIKQQALQQLTPLVGHLEQSPEEQFRTTMMMIQAADNHELIPAAYEAAQQITDEKVRAQALLDIVNEINYFTHNSGSSDSDVAAAA